MPLRETEAIVLRTYRLGEADKIASLFTRQLGRLRAVARGALRPKSRYGGTLEPLSYVRIQIFERENRDLLHLNSVELIESFFNMQADYRVQLAAQYLAEVGERLLPEREVNERTFRLLLAVLRALKNLRGSQSPPPLFRLLDGAARRFSAGICRAAPPAAAPWGKRAATTRGAPNPCCAAIASIRAACGSRPPSWPWCEAACHLPLEKWLAQEKAPPGCREARHFFEEIIESHTEKRLVTRQMMEEEV